MKTVKVNIKNIENTPVKIYQNTPILVDIVNSIIKVNINDDTKVVVETKKFERIPYYADADDFFNGPYDFIPQKDEGFVLETKKLIMKDKITISKIPYAEVENSSGGTTCIIGG